MKKQYLLLACLLCAMSFSAFGQQKVSPWRIGVRVMWGDNPSKFVGGMDDAHATFHTGNYDMGAWRVNFQREFTPRWHAEVGIGVTKYGFRASLSRAYSFSNLEARWSGVGVALRQVEIPVTLIYKHKESCSNWRWFAGVGLSLAFRGNDVNRSRNINDGKDEVVPADGNLNLEVNSANYGALTGHLLLGVEKRLRKGGLINTGLYWNVACKSIAHAVVTYELDGTAYRHEFENKAGYGGLMLNYYFPQFGSRKAARQ